MFSSSVDGLLLISYLVVGGSVGIGINIGRGGLVSGGRLVGGGGLVGRGGGVSGGGPVGRGGGPVGSSLQLRGLGAGGVGRGMSAGDAAEGEALVAGLVGDSHGGQGKDGKDLV